MAAAGFILGNVVAPHAPGMQAPLSFEILDAAGAAVTDFATEHDKQLHLIVVRADGASHDPARAAEFWDREAIAHANGRVKMHEHGIDARELQELME